MVEAYRQDQPFIKILLRQFGLGANRVGVITQIAQKRRNISGGWCALCRGLNGLAGSQKDRHEQHEAGAQTTNSVREHRSLLV